MQARERVLVAGGILITPLFTYVFLWHMKYVIAAVVAGAVGFLILTGTARRAAVVALTFAVDVEILIPIGRVHAYGVLKYAVPAAALLVCLVAWARQPVKRFGWPAWGLLLFLAALVPQTLTHSGDPNAHRQFIVTVGVAIPIVLLAQTLDADQRESMRRVLVWTAAVESAIAVLEVTSHIGPIWGSANNDPITGLPYTQPNGLFTTLVRAQGTLVDPLPLAMILTAGLGALLAGRVCKTVKRDVALAALIITGILFAGARGAFLIAVILLIMWLGSRQRRSLGRATIRLALLLAVLGAAYKLGVGETSVARKLLNSGSVSHRSHSLSSLHNLLTQPAVHVLFGNGFNSAQRLYQQHVLIGDGNFFAIDDQWVTTLSEGGAVALLLLIGWMVYGLIRTDRASRPALIACIGTFFIFDVVLWPSMFAVITLLVGMSGARARPSTMAVEPELVEPLRWSVPV